MRTGVLTPIFKGKGSRADPSGYRPVTVTTTQYKILARAVSQHIGEVIHHIIDPSQIGFQALRRIAENIDLATEAIAYVNEPGANREGVFVFLDNTTAFDRVQWSFLQDTLDAFGFPEQLLRRIVSTMYSQALTCTKVNGHKSAPSLGGVLRCATRMPSLGYAVPHRSGGTAAHDMH